MCSGNLPTAVELCASFSTDRLRQDVTHYSDVYPMTIVAAIFDAFGTLVHITRFASFYVWELSKDEGIALLTYVQ